ncbi:MAG: type II toxin-antitoxin system RelE/ParE family toxin [bacterium]|nr:type II toxin-antitoxin system RelE/ParE family toxin [bacterium]
MWQLEYYQTETGNEPVKGFINSLDDIEEQAEVFAHLAMLRNEGLFLPAPFAKSIPNVKKLKELRIKCPAHIHRVFFFGFTGKKVILLHAFTKKTQKTPQREINIAVKRMKDYIIRKGNL